MYKISRVTIQGFWGEYLVETKLLPEVNIFIGRNGSGKTTLMNILEAVLQVDIRLLTTIDFQAVIIELSSDSDKKKVIVEKLDTEKLSYEHARYEIDGESFELPLFPSEIEVTRAYRHRRHFSETYEAVKKTIASLINFGSLSVHRIPTELVYEDEYPRRPRFFTPPLDQRLTMLLQELTAYQLSLSELVEGVSKAFQKEVLLSILYDANFDRPNWEEMRRVELGKEKEELSKAYEDLGVLDARSKAKIEEQFDVLAEILNKLRGNNFNAMESNPSDMLPLPLLRRTQHIIALSLKAKEAKEEITQPIRKFLKIAQEFISDKELRLTSGGSLEVKRGNKIIPNDRLSSGEKQLLVLLTETLLQKNKPYIFIADEPELSLHIAWQAKIISSIRRLNDNSQLIIATHSPEIAGGWHENIISMEDITYA